MSGVELSKRPKDLRVNFKFSLVDHDRTYDSRPLVNVEFANDCVPPDRDPVEFLRERVLEELDKRTLASPAAQRATKPALVQVCQDQDPSAAPEEEPEEDC